MWREIHPFLDSHGQLKRGIGLPEKQLGMSVIGKTVVEREGPLQMEVSNLDHLAAQSGIGPIEGLLDEPPDEYKYEALDVNAIPPQRLLD